MVPGERGHVRGGGGMGTRCAVFDFSGLRAHRAL